MDVIKQAKNIYQNRPDEFWSTVSQVPLWPLYAGEAALRRMLPEGYISWDKGMSGMLSDSNVYPPLKLYAGDLLYGWGKNRGMLTQDVPPDVARWFQERAITSSESTYNKDGTITAEQGPFYRDAPGYVADGEVDWSSPAFIAYNTLGGTKFDPKTNELVNEGWDYDPKKYGKKSVSEYWDLFNEGKVSLMGMLGKLAYEYGGTREGEGKRQNLKLQY